MLAQDPRKTDSGSNVVYGIHAVETLLSTRMESIDHIYIDKDRRSAPLFNLMKICRKERLAYNLVPAIRLGQIAGTADHQGIAAVCSIKPYSSLQELNEKIKNNPAPLFVLAASIEDPQNLGALIRSCAAFNVDALFLERKNTAPLSPAVAKASAGTVEHQTILRPKNLEGIIRDFGSSGFSIIGTHAGKGKPFSTLNLNGPVIILLGGEHRGIPPYLEKLCVSFANIAINPLVQSLNVSATAAIALYECSRQRALQ